MNETTKNNLAISSQPLEYVPPIEMRRFVQVLLNEGRGSVVETERSTKINRDKFWWRLRRAKDKEQFQRWYIRQVDDFFASYEAVVAKALMCRISDQDVQAMRLYYEIRGRTKNVGGIQVNTQVNLLSKTGFPISCQGCPNNRAEKMSDEELDNIISRKS